MNDSTPDPVPPSLFEGKVCRRCARWVPLSCYRRARGTADGLRTECKACFAAYHKAWSAERRDHLASYKATYYQAHTERWKEQSRARAERLRASCTIPEEKQCRKCADVKPSDDFNRRASSLDGLHPHCKACVAADNRRYKAENRERVAERERRFYAENAERLREAARAYYDRDRHREQAREWRHANPDKKRAIDRRRRNRQLQAPGSHTGAQWEALKAVYGYRCLCCERCEPEITLTEDHVVPLIAGGSDDIDNIQPLCLPCNSRKQRRTIDYRPPRDNTE